MMFSDIFVGSSNIQHTMHPLMPLLKTSLSKCPLYLQMFCLSDPQNISPNISSTAQHANIFTGDHMHAVCFVCQELWIGALINTGMARLNRALICSLQTIIRTNYQLFQSFLFRTNHMMGQRGQSHPHKSIVDE